MSGRHVKDGSLSARDFGGSLPAGPAGVLGPQGPAGPQDAPGPQGAPGLSGYVVVSEYSAHDPAARKDAIASCQEGTRAIGGGAAVYQSPASSVATSKSVPVSDGTAWYALAFETTAIARTGTSARTRSARSSRRRRAMPPEHPIRGVT